MIDLENGTQYYDALKVSINSVQELMDLIKAIIAAGRPYKYITLDTLTKLEDLALPYALTLYKQTPMGKSFTGTNVLDLPNGAGYKYLRDAMTNLLNAIYKCADRIILLGHLKTTNIEKNGKEVSARELDLTGKIKSMVSADVDAIGLLYRGEDSKNILSFKTTDDVICGARPTHLKDQEIVISELVDGKFITHWDKIYNQK
ncbi:MAG: hypothetical protein EBU90_12310 [Proteobacteria bacterium]|nr:hypothetical protein [Pseudomonadota bacterium]